MRKEDLYMKSSMEYEAVEKYENMPDAVSSEVVKFDSFEEIEDIVTATAKGTLVCCFEHQENKRSFMV